MTPSWFKAAAGQHEDAGFRTDDDGTAAGGDVDGLRDDAATAADPAKEASGLADGKAASDDGAHIASDEAGRRSSAPAAHSGSGQAHGGWALRLTLHSQRKQRALSENLYGTRLAA